MELHGFSLIDECDQEIYQLYSSAFGDLKVHIFHMWSRFPCLNFTSSY